MPDVTPAAVAETTPAATGGDDAIRSEAARASAAVPTTWIDSLPGDLKTNPNIAKYKSPEDLYHAHVEMVKLIGKKQDGLVKVPGSDAKPEEISAFRKAMGVPEKPEEYAIPGLDGVPVNQEVLSAFRKAAHEVGITPQQFQALVKFDLDRAAMQAKAREARIETAEKALRTEWGAAYDHKLAMVQRFAEQVGGEEFIQELELRGKDASPVLLKVLDKMATMANEHGLVRGEPVSPITPQEASKRIAEIQADKDYWSDFQNPGRHKELVAEYAKLIHLRK